MKIEGRNWAGPFVKRQESLSFELHPKISGPTGLGGRRSDLWQAATQKPAGPLGRPALPGDLPRGKSGGYALTARCRGGREAMALGDEAETMLPAAYFAWE